MSIHVITWFTGVETIKRQTRAARGCLAGSLQARVCGLSLQSIGCSAALQLCLWHTGLQQLQLPLYKCYVSVIIMILCLSVCFLLPWKSRHTVRLVGQYRTLTVWLYRSIWLVYELSSPRVRESANWLTIELPWSGKSSILVHPSNPYFNLKLTPVHGNRKGI